MDKSISVFKVTMDCSKSLRAMIADCNLNWAHPDITENHFPIKGSGKSEVEVELFHYNKIMTTEQILADFKARGLKPAPIEVGLAFGKENPNIQLEFTIVMLGSVLRGLDCYVPYLDHSRLGRELCLYSLADIWYQYNRFAAVRK